jgi:hypothetical protein
MSAWPAISRDRRLRRLPSARYTAAVILVVLVGLIAQGAALPHTHIGIGPGVYNAEHDLTLLAASGAVAPLPAVPFLFVAIVAAPIVWLPPPSPGSVVVRSAGSRAPPTA